MYNEFAYFYDELMYDVNYNELADYIEAVFRREGVKPELVLDLGCGTGSLSLEMAYKGYDMIGIDYSEEMLNCAQVKSIDAKQDILLLNQDMRDFELYGTVDAILCTMDSINYITSYEDIVKVFKKVNLYLNPGALFIFDINTEYKLRNIIGNNLFYDVDEALTYIWDNEYNEEDEICRFDLTFFIQDEDGRYERYDETHHQRAYSNDEILSALKEADLEYICSYNDMSFCEPAEKSQRVFYIARERQKKETV